MAFDYSLDRLIGDSKSLVLASLVSLSSGIASANPQFVAEKATSFYLSSMDSRPLSQYTAAGPIGNVLSYLLINPLFNELDEIKAEDNDVALTLWYPVMVIDKDNSPIEGKYQLLENMRVNPKGYTAWSIKPWGDYSQKDISRINQFVPSGVERKVVPKDIARERLFMDWDRNRILPNREEFDTRDLQTPQALKDLRFAH
ncbi:MAG: hypothetical protein AABW79_04085 [Nanoarchaeota archaeon]